MGSRKGEVIIIELIEALQKQINFCERERNYKCGVYVISRIKKDIVIKVISNLLPVLNREVEIRNNQCESYVKFPNGNLIRVVSANNTARGHRFNGIIVDSMVDREIVDTVIMPHLMPLFDENNRYDTYDNPLKRLYFCNIDANDVIKSAKYRPILYATSARGNGKSQKQLKDIMNAIAYGLKFESANYDKNIFEKEYECMFYENDYNRPVVEKELNGDKVMLYEAWGIPKNMVTYETEFVNKTKQTYLNISGRYEMPELGFENDLNIHLFIDTKIYDGYEVHVEDGLVTVVLHEIKNEAPVLKDYGVA